MQKKITYRIGDVSKIYSGGDRPEIYSDIQNSECPIPIYSNGLDNEGLYGYTNKSQIEGDCITVAARGVNIGTVFYRPTPFLPIVRLLSVIPNRTLVNAKYLYYYFQIDTIIGTGSAQPQLTIPFFQKKKILIHEDISYQQKIASILSAYDNLIQNYKKQIEALQTAASELYKEWFVRFRFPGYQTTKFENGIPEGWKVVLASELGEFVRGKNITAEEMQEGMIPVISAGIEPSGFHNQSNVKGVSLTISNSGANAGYLQINYSNIWAADCSYCNSAKHIYFYYELLNNMRVVLFNLQKGAAQPHVYAKDINKMKIILPPSELIETANKKIKLMHEKIYSLQQQITNLTQQRDLLLPRLMSGKLEVE